MMRAIVVGALMVVSSAAQPQQANNELECRIYADLASTARAHRMVGVERGMSMRAIRHMYTLPTDDHVHVAARINEVAYRDDQRDNVQFGMQLYESCTKHKGSLTHFLGVAS